QFPMRPALPSRFELQRRYDAEQNTQSQWGAVMPKQPHNLLQAQTKTLSDTTANGIGIGGLAGVGSLAHPDLRTGLAAYMNEKGVVRTVIGDFEVVRIR